MNQTLEEELEQLHKEEQHEEIIERISQLPSEELNAKILGKLARANSNLGHFLEALKILKEIEKEESQTSLWNYRVGHLYLSLEEYENAQKYLEKAFEINPEESNVDKFLCYVYVRFAEQAQQQNDMEKILEYCEKIKYYADYGKNTEALVWVNFRLAGIYDQRDEFEEGKRSGERSGEDERGCAGFSGFRTGNEAGKAMPEEETERTCNRKRKRWKC